MERALLLLEKLRTQLQRNEPRDRLIITLRLLHAEIASLEPAAQEAPTQRVTVIVPGAEPFPSLPDFPEAPRAEAPREVQVLQVDEGAVEAELEAIKAAAELRNNIIRPVVEEASPEDEAHVPEPFSDTFPSSTFAQDPTPRQMAEAPVQVAKEPASLNERLRSITIELSDRLGQEPVGDLRKAIGINDRYQYIHELFKGDDQMFERSIKTLNDFSSLAEARFWIERELRLRLGWDENAALVKQFHQLVSRRFS